MDYRQSCSPTEGFDILIAEKTESGKKKNNKNNYVENLKRLSLQSHAI
jgi:hypothetical protein